MQNVETDGNWWKLVETGANIENLNESINYVFAIWSKSKNSRYNDICQLLLITLLKFLSKLLLICVVRKSDETKVKTQSNWLSKSYWKIIVNNVPETCKVKICLQCNNYLSLLQLLSN